MAGAVAARLVFYPTLLYNMLLEKLSRREWYNRIDSTVLLGALPFRRMSRREWSALGVEQLRQSTIDMIGIPTQENLKKGVKFALKHQELGNSVYIHCKAGRSRSATMVAAYLIQVHRWSPHEARDFIKNIRPQIIIRPGQFEALERFHSWVSSDSPVESGG